MVLGTCEFRSRRWIWIDCQTSPPPTAPWRACPWAPWDAVMRRNREESLLTSLKKKKTWLAGNSPCSLGNTSSKWWWQLKHLLFSPRFNGEMIQFDEQIFQMGWNFTFSNRKYSFKRWIFHCHVSIRGVNILEHPKVGPGSRYKSSEITPRSGVK